MPCPATAITSAAVSVPLTVPLPCGHCGGTGTVAGGLPLVLHRNRTTPPLRLGRPKWICAWITAVPRSRYVSVYAIDCSSLLTFAKNVPLPVELRVDGV